MINYLFSGIDKINGFTKEQSSFLTKDINDNSTITFISSVPNDYEKNDMQLTQFINLFEKIGVKFKKSTVIDKRIDKNLAKEIVENSDIVFLLGGIPDSQMNFINEYDLATSIKKKSLIIGVSAGSMNQSKRVIYKDDFDNYVLKDYKGLGIVDINIFPHIDLNNKKIMDEITEVNEIIPLILLPNNSFVRIENKNIEIIGNYYKL